MSTKRGVLVKKNKQDIFAVEYSVAKKEIIEL